MQRHILDISRLHPWCRWRRGTDSVGSNTRSARKFPFFRKQHGNRVSIRNELILFVSVATPASRQSFVTGSGASVVGDTGVSTVDEFDSTVNVDVAFLIAVVIETGTDVELDGTLLVARVVLSPVVKREVVSLAPSSVVL